MRNKRVITTLGLSLTLCLLPIMGLTAVSSGSPTDLPDSHLGARLGDPTGGRYSRENVPGSTILQASVELLEAAKNLDMSGVEGAITRGADPNYLGGDFAQYKELADSPLNSAVRGLDMQSSHASPLRRSDLDVKCIRILKSLFLAGAKFQECDKKILYWPIIDGYHRVVLELLERGADSTQTVDAMTFVELAEKYGHEEIADSLVLHGGKPIPPQEVLQLRLIHAAEFGRLWEMDQLIENGASVNRVTRLGRTALGVLADDNRYDIEQYAKVSLLVQEGANPNLEAVLMQNNVPQIALHSAMLHSADALQGNLGLERRLYARLIIEALIRVGADVNRRGVNGATPLEVAVRYKNREGVKMLLEAGADACTYGSYGFAPLHWAINIDLRAVEMLLEAHADPNAPSRTSVGDFLGEKVTITGITPLHLAAKLGNSEGARILLAAGADSHVHDSNGKTPLDYAQSDEMIELLKGDGVKGR